MSNLSKYHAVQMALALSQDGQSKWTVTEDKIAVIEKLFESYVDESRLVVVPRFNGSYISFRYCGLEVLRLSRAGLYRTCIECTANGIRGTKEPKDVAQLEALTPLLAGIKSFLEGYLCDFRTATKTRKQAKAVPGFSLEHWLESVILADNPIGEKARTHLGLNRDLTKVVSQAPVILLPSAGKELKGQRKRHHLVDVLSVNDDGRFSVVELKKDNDLQKAVTELEEYTDWLLKRGVGFDPARGNPAAMAREHYLPKADYDCAAASIDAIAVVLPSHGPVLATLPNGVKLRVVELPEDWLLRKGSIFAE